MIAIPLAKKIAELFLILFAAAALVKAGILKTENSKVLSRLSLYFVTPCVVFNSFLKELTPEITRGLLTAAALAAGFQALFFLIAAVLRRLWKATEVERASVVFTNVGNLVIPLVAFAKGQDWVIYTSAYILVFNLLFWTMGVRMFDSENALNLKKVLLNPNLLATAAGLVMLFARIKLPEPVALAFSDVAAMIGPLTMMITGMVVGGMTFRGMFANRRVFGVLFFRMILASGLAVLAAVLIARVLPVDKSIVLIPLLGALAPSGSNINQMAILYNKDAQYASAINVLTTLSCIATIPLWVMVFEALAG
ncbi:MAG: AEC family transporter [Clostridia bacterium]|nr:AEC family transporter [Clostridia bacterium]